MTKYVELTWKDFQEQFRPIKNHFRKDPDEIMFETYGEELEFVISKVEENVVWTYGDGDYCTYVSGGYHYINRIGYYITEVPMEKDTEYQITISTEQECTCYKEEGYPNEEYGDPDCLECEGSGYVTNWID
jgi:hypothetical protein